MLAPFLLHRRRFIGRDPDEEHRAATPLELFYDLTIVVAFGTAADELAHFIADAHAGAGIAGFAFALLHLPVPEWIESGFKLVGDALIPMMLLSLGVRLLDVRWSDSRIGIIGGLVCPVTGIAMAALLGPVLRLDDSQLGLLILFGCLPPAVLNFMVAEQFRQELG